MARELQIYRGIAMPEVLLGISTPSICQLPTDAELLVELSNSESVDRRKLRPSCNIPSCNSHRWYSTSW